MNEVFTANFAGRPISIKANYVAKRANAGVLVTYGETVVLVTAVSHKAMRENIDFFPLTVDYQEMTFAAGKIPGGFFKREGRPNEREILTSRIIDRSIRPLFPKGFFQETQIVATVLSLDPETGSDVTAMLGASVALGISDIPFGGPIAGIRVGMEDGRFVANPSASVLEKSEIDLFLTGRKADGASSGKGYDVQLVMLEGGAREIEEERLSEAIQFGLDQLRPVIELQEEMMRAIGKRKIDFQPLVIEPGVRKEVEDRVRGPLREAFSTPEKMAREALLARVQEDVVAEYGAREGAVLPAARAVLEEMGKKVLREKILNDHTRIDGRPYDEVRSITCEVGLLPRTHGSALFTRGETQSLAVVTLGTSSDEQRLDWIGGEEFRSFLLHYNFPPYCVGEARMLRGPGRREIGHGVLARRALLPILPDPEAFPYTIRIVSEILSSNGSSSMATVCGGSLSLMDAGVPVKTAVAGIAMGLLKEGDQVVILSDILGDEDHAGDMDFKVCGTRQGVTAVQMDIKIAGITGEIIRQALSQARKARLFILEKMEAAISEPRKDLSVYAPRITTLKVKPEKIRDVIGSGGKNIRQIVNETGVVIDVEDDGTVTIASNDAAAAAKAVAMVKWLTEEAEIGKIYLGTVKKVVDFGAFVEILPGTEGLVHISQLDRRRVQAVTDVVKEGDKIPVKVLEIDKSGKIRLSRKEALNENV
jgi:polyribonucleotide nucleotidyltransferase